MAISSRIAPILAAYVASCIVASIVLVLALAFSGGGGGPYDLGFLSAFAALAGFVAAIIAVAALLPTLAFGLYAERHSLRSPLFYGIAGMCAGLIGFALYLAVLQIMAPPGAGFATANEDGSLLAVISGLAGVVAVAGALSGLTYWIIAGRRAGAS